MPTAPVPRDRPDNRAGAATATTAPVTVSLRPAPGYRSADDATSQLPIARRGRQAGRRGVRGRDAGAVDFGTQDLAAVLAEHGYRRDLRTLFVWEAVTQYLDERGVRATFDFGLAPDEVEDFLAPYGWDEVEQVGPAEYATRYLEPAGRPLPVSEIERCVLAVKG